MPDSSTYTSIAGELRKAYAAGNGILTVRTEFRMLGYPVLLAAIAEFTPEKTYAPLYIIQIAFAVLSSLVLFLTLRRLGLNAVSGGVLALIFLAAYPLPLASFVLTDAINNALTAIALCLLVLLCVAAQPRSMGLIVLLGGAGMATAFLVRESNQYLWLTFLPLVVAATWSRTWSVRACFASVLLFALPILLTVEGYKSFNAVRLGERKVTTGGRTAMMQPVVGLAREHPEIYDGPTPLDRASRESLRTYEFSDIIAINSKLFALGLGENEIDHAARTKFAEAWQRYPISMLTEALVRAAFAKQAVALLNPFGSLDWAVRWRNPSAIPLYQRFVGALRAGSVQTVVASLLFTFGALISVVVFLFFFVGVPIAAFRAIRRGETSAAVLLLALPVCYAGYAMMYALINMEMRYLGGIAVLPILALPLAMPWLSGQDMSGRV
jgi:hypothetical protein